MITLVLEGSTFIVKSLIEDGDINLLELLSTTSKNTANASFRASVAASLTVSAKCGFLGEMCKEVSPEVIGAVTTIALNAVSDSIKVFKGEMSKEEFAERCIRNSVVVAAGVGGAYLGQALIPIPILGAMIGNFVGSMLANIVYDGSKQLFFSFFIQSGFSFFCIVKKDYQIPEEVLKQCGFDLIELNKVKLDLFEIDSFEIDRINVDTLSFRALKRGMISDNTIGYL